MALGSLNFRGPLYGDYVTCGNVPTSGLSALTVEAMVKFAFTGASEGVVTKNGATGQNWTLYVTASGLVRFWVKNFVGAAQQAEYSGGLLEDTWYHVAGVYNGATVKVYVNGVAGASAPTLTGTVSTSTQAVEFARNAGAEWLEGRIGWARISNSARYTTNFTSPMMPPKADANTLAQWNFTEGRYTTLDNIVGTATYDGVVTGATWKVDTPWLHTVLDSFHVVEVKLDGVDYWANLVQKSLRFKDGVDSQVPTLDFSLEEYGTTLPIVGWKTAILTIDGQQVFGGYVTKARPAFNRAGRITWEVQCEGWVTVFNRSPPFQKTYAGLTPGAILVDIFNQAGLTGYDTVSHVTPGDELAHFYVSKQEKLTDAIDRLVLMAGEGTWVWNVDAEKRVWMGPPSERTSPFSLAATASATYTTTFPVLKWATEDIDETDIRNRITVRGGTTPSSSITDTFDGDGRTLIYTLTESPIYDVIRVTVDGIPHPHGVDWVHTFGGEFRCLVNYITGTVRWDTGDAPPEGANNVVVVYRRADDVQVQVTSATSYARYGRYFDYVLEDGGITTLAEATLVANALLALYALPNVLGTATVERWGIQAGQSLAVEIAPLFTGSYTVREVVCEMTDTYSFKLSLKFGDKLHKMRAISDPGGTGHGSLTGTRTIVGGGSTPGSGGGGVGGLGGGPPIDGEINLVRLNRRMEIIDRNTDYDPTTYGNATGVVLEYNPDTQEGRILGLRDGVLRGYLDSDGAIKGGGGVVIIGDDGIRIVAPSGAPSPSEMYRFTNADGSVTYVSFYARLASKMFGVVAVDPHAGVESNLTLSATGASGETGTVQIVATGDSSGTLGTLVVEAGKMQSTLTATADTIQTVGETRLGSVANYLMVDGSGQVLLVGDATQFVEVFLPAHGMYQSGAKPDWVKAIGNIFYPAFDPDTDEELHGSLLIPASYKDGSNITVGIRWLAIGDGEGGEQVRWGLEYAWCDKNEVLAAASGDIGVTAPAAPPVVAYKHYDTQFGAITGTGMLGGSTFAFRLYRDANHADDDWIDDVYLVGLYIRFEVDKLGANS